jgi:hypothetical protein
MFVWLSSAEEIFASQVPDESEIKISRIFRADEGFCGVEFVAINLEEFFRQIGPSQESRFLTSPEGLASNVMMHAAS